MAALLITAGIASAGHYKLTDTRTDTVSTAQYRMKWRHTTGFDEDWNLVYLNTYLTHGPDGEDPPGTFKFLSEGIHYRPGGGQYYDIYGVVQKYDETDGQWKDVPGAGHVEAIWVP